MNTQFSINVEVLVKAVRENLGRTATPEVARLALTALGFEELADRYADDVIRLNETEKLVNEAPRVGADESIFGSVGGVGPYDDEYRERVERFWNNVREVKQTLGLVE